MPQRNYDLSKLEVFLPEKPVEQTFVLDQTELDAYENIIGGFTSLSVSHSCSVDKSVLFRPETSTLRLTTTNMDLAEGLYGQRIKAAYKDVVLFDGYVRSITVNADLDGETVTIGAVNGANLVKDVIALNVDYPAETVSDRLSRLLGLLTNTRASVTMKNRADGKLGRVSEVKEESVPVFGLMQRLSDMMLARFFTKKDGTLTLDQTVPTVPDYVLSDEADADFSYNGIELTHNLDAIVTKVTAISRPYPTAKDTYAVSGAAVTKEAAYEIDAPVPAGNLTYLTEWVNEFPTSARVKSELAGLSLPWKDAMLTMELANIVAAYYRGKRYGGVVTGMSFNITPRAWNVDLELAPSLIAGFKSDAPSAPATFTAGTAALHSLAMSWTAPEDTYQHTGYELRRSLGNIPPEKNQGTLVATFPTTTLSYTDTGLNAGETYSYSLFATTDFTDVFSEPATMSAKTTEEVPLAPTIVEILKYDAHLTDLKFSVSFNTPTNNGGYNLKAYDIRVDARDPNNRPMYVERVYDLESPIIGTLNYHGISGYYISIRAVSRDYVGAWSAEVYYNNG